MRGGYSISADGYVYGPDGYRLTADEVRRYLYGRALEEWPDLARRLVDAVQQVLDAWHELPPDLQKRLAEVALKDRGADRGDPAVNEPAETVWIVVHEVPFESSTIVGVYATEQLARLAADHPYAPLSVQRFDVVHPSGDEIAAAEVERHPFDAGEGGGETPVGEPDASPASSVGPPRPRRRT